MFRKRSTPIAACAFLGSALFSPVHARQLSAETRDVKPFTHLAYVSADSDANSIHFDSVKLVRFAGSMTAAADTRYCADLAFRDPGGSMYCPDKQSGAWEEAYEVTYSYNGEPLASDESGGRHFTFHLYFRADELNPALRQALSVKKRIGVEASEYFAVSAERPIRQTKVVDDAQSSFCEGNFVDGAWVRSDASCQDRIIFRTVTARDSSIAVKVSPVSRVLSASK